MPPKAKAAAASNGATGAPKSKGSKSGTTSAGTSTPVPPEERQESTASASTGLGKPEKSAYDAEQEKIRKDIDAVQAKLVCHLHCDG